MELRGEALIKTYLRRSGLSNVLEAVKETDITVAAGSMIAVTGRSGSGKSTLLCMLAGLLTPTSGKVYVSGKDLYAMDDRERSVLRNTSFGIIPQGQSSLGSLTVLENVLAPAMMYGKKPDRERAGQLMERLGIENLASAYPSELSGGELRRMAIARALILNPGIILADEPTGDLDDENTAEVLSVLREEADRGAAVFLVTHESMTEKYADKVFRMKAGKLDDD